MDKNGRWTLFLSLAAALGSGAASAVTYNYAGTNFTSASGPYDTTMSVSVEFTVATQLPPNQPSTDISAQVTSYTMFDGVQTLTEANSQILSFSVATGTGGNPRSWAITAWATPITTMVGGSLAGIDTIMAPTFNSDDGFTDATCSATNGPGGQCSAAIFGPNLGAHFAGAPGTWSCGDCVTPPVSPARLWTESGDAPSFPDGPAQLTRGQGALQAIRGATGAGDLRDAYCVRIVDPLQFLATTDPRSDLNADGDFDTRLFLFLRDGAPRLANDDRAPQQFPLRSTVGPFSGDFSFGPPFPDEYVLVVAGSPDQPEDGSAVGLFDVAGNAEVVLGPNPAAGRFEQWDAPGGISATGAYTVILGGAEYCQSDLDATFANDGSNDRLCLGDDAGDFACGDLNAHAGAQSAVAMGFVDFDRNLDAVFAVDDLSANRVCLGTGTGQFACSAVDAALESTRGVALGHIDGDQHLDAVFANVVNNSGSSENQVCLGTGTGGFNCADVSADDNLTQGVALGYVDADAHLDAVFANEGTSNHICLGDGTGAFTCSNVSADANATFGVALGLIDGDAHPDAVFANLNQTNRVCFGDAAGGFSTCSDIDSDTGSSSAVAIGFVDGDANLDAVFANAGQANRACLGDGMGGFVCSDVSARTEVSEDVALGLIDGDAHLDAVFANNAQNSRVCLGDGAGAFPTCSNPFGARAASRGVALGEVVASEIFADGFESGDTQ